MSGTTIDAFQILSQLEDILDSEPRIDELGFIHPSQFDALNEEVQSSPSSASGATPQVLGGSMLFWHNKKKLGISSLVLVPLYRAAKDAFMKSYKQYRMLSRAPMQRDEYLDIVESEVMKHSRALLLLSCDFGTAWNARKLIVSKKLILSMLMEELFLSALVLSCSPKSERAWSHRRWVIKMIAGKCPKLQEIVERDSELVKAIVENSKMNYRAWNHRCWLVSYMSNLQVLHELQNSRDWAGLHVADNSCFHYRACLLLKMMENFQHNKNEDALSGANFHQIWKEELDWVGMLIRRYLGREALWLHRRFLSLEWIKHLTTDDQSVRCHSCSGRSDICNVTMFIKDELLLFHSCTTIPDNEFEDYQAQATYSATYIAWLAKKIPKSFRFELQRSAQYEALKSLLNNTGKRFLWDSIASSHQ